MITRKINKGYDLQALSKFTKRIPEEESKDEETHTLQYLLTLLASYPFFIVFPRPEYPRRCAPFSGFKMSEKVVLLEVCEIKYANRPLPWIKFYT